MPSASTSAATIPITKMTGHGTSARPCISAARPVALAIAVNTASTMAASAATRDRRPSLDAHRIGGAWGDGPVLVHGAEGDRHGIPWSVSPIVSQHVVTPEPASADDPVELGGSFAIGPLLQSSPLFGLWIEPADPS